MAAAGVPDYLESHPAAAADMALDMLHAIKEFNEKHDTDVNLRIGLNSGPVVAGIIGTRKFTYDLWGDTVNIAARMESHGEPGKIQVSDSTALLLKRTHILEERGEVEVKGKGKIKTFWLVDRIQNDQ
jgi:class 3 adenylate cyclase